MTGMRSLRRRSGHQPQRQRIPVAAAIGGFDRSDDRQNEGNQADNYQHRNSDEDEDQRYAADAVDEHRDMEIQRFARICPRVFRIALHREINHQRQKYADTEHAREVAQNAPDLIVPRGGRLRNAN